MTPDQAEAYAERVAIKMESGIPEAQAEREAREEMGLTEDDK